MLACCDKAVQAVAGGMSRWGAVARQLGGVCPFQQVHTHEPRREFIPEQPCYPWHGCLSRAGSIAPIAPQKQRMKGGAQGSGASTWAAPGVSGVTM